MPIAPTALPNDDAVLGVLRTLLGGRKVRVLDLGGGTGVFAVPFAVAGHDVVVLDHSNDALAMLGRRAQAEGVGAHVTGHNVDLDRLTESIEPATADLVLCHRALEHVQSPGDTLAAAARALSPNGLLSVVVTNRPGAVLSRIIAGRFEEADAVLDGVLSAQAGHRFDAAQLRRMVEALGMEVVELRGVGLIGELNPENAATPAGRALAERVSADPFLAQAAPLLHLVARVGP